MFYPWQNQERLPLHVNWYGMEQTQNGVILTLTCDIADTAANGTNSIEFSYRDGEITDNEFKNVPADIYDGSLLSPAKHQNERMRTE